MIKSFAFLVFVAVYGSLALGQDIERGDVRKYLKADGLYRKAETQLKKGNLLKSADYLRQCLRDYPDHSDAHFLSSRIEFLQGEFRGALDDILKAKSSLAKMSEMADFVQKYRRMRVDQHRIRALNDEMRRLSSIRAIRTGCQAEMAATEMVGILVELQSPSPSTNIPMRVFRLVRMISYLFTEGGIRLRLGEPVGARGSFVALLGLHPGYAEAYNGLAQCSFLQKEFRHALHYLDQALLLGGSDMKEMRALSLQALDKAANDLQREELPGGGLRFEIPGDATSDAVLINTYVVFDENTKDAVIIDPGGMDARIDDYIEKNGLAVKKILNTHGHGDHSGANRHYAERYGAQIMSSEKDLALYAQGNAENKPDEYFGDDVEIRAGSLSVRAIPTPGHSPGSVCFLINGGLYTGDTLFFDSIGRVEGSNDDEKEKNLLLLVRQIRERLFTLGSETPVYPGHGIPTTLQRENSESLFFMNFKKGE